MARRIARDEGPRRFKHYVKPDTDLDQLIRTVTTELRTNFRVDIYITGVEYVSENAAWVREYVTTKLDEAAQRGKIRKNALNRVSFI